MPTRPSLFMCVAALVTFIVVGCSTPGSPFGALTGGHRAIDSMKELRAQATEPLDLPRELNKHVSPPYIVEPGDVLLVQPADLDSPIRLPGDQAILPDGTIALGRYGRLIVAGKTLEEIEVLVRAQIQAQTKDVGPITVRLVARQSKVYYVLGEVNAPGAFTFNGRETVLDAIVAAGGLTDRASRNMITLSRPTPPNSCREVLPICYNEIVQIGDTSTNYQIRAGDRVYVPTKTLHEQLCPPKTPCPPCGKPQTSCYLTGAACNNPTP